MATRFAPSPTGLLHLGHAFAAFMAWEEAARSSTSCLLRLEDIDVSRTRPEFTDAIFADLAWLGLSWPTPVWLQSQRMPAYADALTTLDRLGLLYPCFCTRHDLLAIDAPQGPDGPLYPGTCRTLSPMQRDDLIASGKPFALRLDSTRAISLAGPLTWTDLNAGPQSANPALLGDAVLARKDIRTSYHLAVVVDDAAQHISVVTRGDDLFASTHLHRLLQALLNLPVPLYRHHRLIRDDLGRRLAKRDGARSLQSLRQNGLSPADIRQLLEPP